MDYAWALNWTIRFQLIKVQKIEILLQIIEGYGDFGFIAIYLFRITGTHDIVDANFSIIESKFTVRITFAPDSAAKGALISLIFMENGAEADFNRSTALALDRNHTEMLPLESLYPGQYFAYFYDIESDGLINGNLIFPALTLSLSTTQGKFSMIVFKVKVMYQRGGSNLYCMLCTKLLLSLIRWIFSYANSLPTMY